MLLASWFRESVWMTLGDKLLRRFLLLVSIFVFLVSVFSQIPPVWTTQAVADQSSMTVYTGQYLKQLQGASNDRLDNATWRAACTAGVALRRPTRRGCRGGSRKQRHTQQTGVNNANLLTITPHNQLLTAKLCLIKARSVCNKAELIVDYVTSHDIDIMCITETWLRSEDTASVSAVTPSGYHLEHVARSNGRGGGVSVLFRSSFSIDHSQLWPFECLDLQLRCRSVSSTLRLFVLYRPPSSSRNSQPFGIFLTEFRDLIERVGLETGVVGMWTSMTPVLTFLSNSMHKKLSANRSIMNPGL